MMELCININYEFHYGKVYFAPTLFYHYCPWCGKRLVEHYFMSAKKKQIVKDYIEKTENGVD